ncbi:MAG: winged helix-turn-helix domain-containing protein [Promethearchaeota archaeon]
MIINKKTKRKFRKGINWADEIHNYLRENPFGQTIKDIAEGVSTSRVTVYKYIKMLQDEGKVFAREVGLYKLYYCSDRIVLPLRFMSKYYNGILRGLKNKFTNLEEFKKLGHIIADGMRRELINQYPKSLRAEIKSFNDFLTYFPKLYPYLDLIMNENVTIEEEIEPDKNKGVFIFKNLEMLEVSEDFQYHYYIITGILERGLSWVFQKNIHAEILNLDVKEKCVKILLEQKE